MIVAIDGPAGAGKSTTARNVARELGFAYVDTGAMYRAVALICHERHLDPADEATLTSLAEELPMHFTGGGTQLLLGERDVSGEIRSPEVGALASRVASLPRVRERVVERQRVLARAAEQECGGAVLEGRDIQTVVFPDAAVKVFLTATSGVRALRRLQQWDGSGQAADLQQAERDVLERDERDESRAASPLLAAPDAVHISTDDHDPAAVAAAIVALAREKME